MHNLNLLKSSKVTRIANSAVAGTSDVTCTTLDMTGFDSIMIVAAVGDVTNTCVLTLKLQSGSDSGGSGAADISGATTSAFTADATSADNKLIVLDVHRPISSSTSKYVTAVLSRTVANAVVDGVWAIQYNARDIPTTQPSSVVASAFVQIG